MRDTETGWFGTVKLTPDEANLLLQALAYSDLPKAEKDNLLLRLAEPEGWTNARLVTRP